MGFPEYVVAGPSEMLAITGRGISEILLKKKHFGETRVLAASMTMEQIFKGTKEFKQEVFDKVQLELNQFGLYIYNANVKQLVDVPGHEYFSYLSQKTQMEAANQAKIDVTEANMKGEIGAKLRDGETKKNAAKIDAETLIISTRRQGENKKEPS
ncbi:hypothetical protein RND71_017394 [Anisodus tanguticus]|uniref:Flotillin-like n=1 Tax=Anisodus tanguticus TaxID=243964 RepID=A0AAE1V9Z2_9SOLA|nr:hypothetical protein RND71_017394 [Anisodus tanguticus]